MLSLLLPGLVALAQAAPHKGTGARDANKNLPANLVRDYESIKPFVKEVSGPHDILANWTGTDVCNWKGFYCDTNPSTNVYSLASIDFEDFGLQGHLELASWVPKLKDLALLHANTNGFSGEFPDLSALTELYEVDLSNNKFSGPFPEKVYTAPGLDFLDLRFNDFSGPLPGKLFSFFTQMEALFLNSNHFSGPIPQSIGQFTGKYLVLANNKLSGPIPASLASASKLQELLLTGNQLTGSIPSGLGGLKNLDVLDISQNKLSGPIPGSLASASKLQQLVLSNNQLTGSIPTGFGALSHLENFDVSNNKLTGTVPEDLCCAKSIKSINVSGNHLSGNLGPKCLKAKKKGILKL